MLTITERTILSHLYTSAQVKPSYVFSATQKREMKAAQKLESKGVVVLENINNGFMCVTLNTIDTNS